ncbi:MAG: thioredoxin [Ilumatobacteraceae bacterium]
MGTLLDINDATFATEVLQAKELVVVDFWAPWCGPCRTVSKVLEDVQAKVGPKVKIVKMNIDENQEQALAYNVMLLPTVIVFKNGEIQDRLQGGVAPSKITSMIDAHLEG